MPDVGEIFDDEIEICAALGLFIVSADILV